MSRHWGSNSSFVKAKLELFITMHFSIDHIRWQKSHAARQGFQKQDVFGIQAAQKKLDTPQTLRALMMNTTTGVLSTEAMGYVGKHSSKGGRVCSSVQDARCKMQDADYSTQTSNTPIWTGAGASVVDPRGRILYSTSPVSRDRRRSSPAVLPRLQSKRRRGEKKSRPQINARQTVVPSLLSARHGVLKVSKVS